ncbi:carbonic anhydrase [Sphingobium algorifonticola]|uniref:Carbonic anhydrase n=1 Tax=Sphingobium algorifonticola TaxID=2008318 RepID=A0A437JE22_9SPHN|nr:carbonic anhydrase [Sphingobium algorifonticola]RVT43862.1 carbonic anhydrase [Sphingobium algorifonticola]
MKSYKQLLLANKAWSMELKEENPDFFKRQLNGQMPDFLWIGCSDSRVNPEQMTMTPPGGMFIHRNIANLVNEDDINLMSVLQYAVAVLQVKHVIICGHYGCGGIMAAYDGQVDGPVDIWLENARAVRENHSAEIYNAGDREAQVNRFVEVNVRDQLVKLAQTKTVQAAFAAGQPLALHGWVYDLRDGLIKPLMEIDARTRLETIGQPERVLL